MSDVDSASFRDPSGFVYMQDGRVYRQVNPSFTPCYRQFAASGLQQDLESRRLITKCAVVADHEETLTLECERIPFISYPYEWSFAQLKDAALLTLELCQRALDFGLVLKDASAYNVQFVGPKAVFIDTLSFEPYVDCEPWIAYGQFCRHFLAPLAVAAFGDGRTLRWQATSVDGLALDIAVALLPWRAKLRSGLFAHLFLHAKAESAHGDDARRANTKVSKTALLALLDSLRRTVEKLSWSGSGQWSNYYSDTNYRQSAADSKRQIVRDFIAQVTPVPELCFDLGANDATITDIAADCGVYCVAFDLDMASVQRAYHSSRARVLPLVQDLANPSPGIGWGCVERKSLFDRGPANLVLALALVHHLRITNQVPLPQIAATLARLGEWAIVEFVPKEDSQVQRLLRSRPDIFEDYTIDGFNEAIAQHFEVIATQPVTESLRSIFLLRRR